MKSLIEAEDTPNLALRVAVRPGGCSGFSYEMYFDADQADDDIKTEHGGVTVVIDPASFQHLAGGALDYKDGLQGAGFHITNPNASAPAAAASPSPRPERSARSLTRPRRGHARALSMRVRISSVANAPLSRPVTFPVPSIAKIHGSPLNPSQDSVAGTRSLLVRSL